jgi:hypothetical protein
VAHVSENERLRRRHHVVPRFHLQQFADTRGRVVRVALPGDHRHPISIKDAAVENDFYLVEQEDGSKHDEVEKILATAEGRAAKAMGQMLTGAMWPVTPDAREAIAVWASLQYLRTPLRRRMMNELGDSIAKMQIAMGGKDRIRDALEERDGRPPKDAEVDDVWAEYIDFDSYTLEPHANEHLRSMFDMLPAIVPTFYNRGWKIYRFRRRGLATSDHPVVLFPADDHNPLLGVGLRNAGALYMPLARRFGLLMTSFGGDDELRDGTTSLAHGFNWGIAAGAYRALFHHPDDDPFALMDLPAPRDTLTNAAAELERHFPSRASPAEPLRTPRL